jgi:hypothetical protein
MNLRDGLRACIPALCSAPYGDRVTVTDTDFASLPVVELNPFVSIIQGRAGASDAATIPDEDSCACQVEFGPCCAPPCCRSVHSAPRDMRDTRSLGVRRSPRQTLGFLLCGLRME